ncbi:MULTISPECIES: hypothetical protein [Pseudomonas]|jgi:hypothetical protein|nr:hypothetical protein [Pseudomonas rhodesiae]
MSTQKSESLKEAVPFLVGGDGRIYIAGATIKASTVTKAKLLA